MEGGAKGRGQTFMWSGSGGGGGGQEDDIAMKGAQSKVKWGTNGGPHGVNGVGHAPLPPILTPFLRLYA